MMSRDRETTSRPSYDRGVHRARQAPRTVAGLVLIALAAISWGTSGSVMTVLAERAAHDRGVRAVAARRAAGAACAGRARAGRAGHRAAGGVPASGAGPLEPISGRRAAGVRGGSRVRALRACGESGAQALGAAAHDRADVHHRRVSPVAGPLLDRWAADPARTRLAVAALSRRRGDGGRVRDLYDRAPAGAGIG